MIRRPGELCVSSRSGGGIGRQRRRQTSVERENQERIDRENRILLRKILEQHHGVRRSSAIPPPPNKAHKQKYPLSSTGKYFLQQGPLTCVDILRWFLTPATTHINLFIKVIKCLIWRGIDGSPPAIRLTSRRWNIKLITKISSCCKRFKLPGRRGLSNSHSTAWNYS